MTHPLPRRPRDPSARPAPHSRRGALLAIGLATLVAVGCADAADVAVSLEHARAEHEAGRALLIDIREPQEHATGVAAGAHLLPMRQLGARLAEIPLDPSRPVLLICNTQNRSRATLRALREHGYSHVRYVDGGMSEWARRGWPMVRPGSSAVSSPGGSDGSSAKGSAPGTGPGTGPGSSPSGG